MAQGAREMPQEEQETTSDGRELSAKEVVDAVVADMQMDRDEDKAVLAQWFDAFVEQSGELSSDTGAAKEDFITSVGQRFVEWVRQHNKVDTLSRSDKMRFALFLSHFAQSYETKMTAADQEIADLLNKGNRKESLNLVKGTFMQETLQESAEEIVDTTSRDEGKKKTVRSFAGGQEITPGVKDKEYDADGNPVDVLRDRAREVMETVAPKESDRDGGEKKMSGEQIWHNAAERVKGRKAAEADGERVVIDLAQEIGMLREKIAQTDGNLAQHKEKIAQLIEKLNVSRESFGQYGVETDLLAKKVDDLTQKMRALESRAQKEEGIDSKDGDTKESAERGTAAFDAALAQAKTDNAASFVVGENTYVRVGDTYILDPQLDAAKNTQETVAAGAAESVAAGEDQIAAYKEKFTQKVNGADGGDGGGPEDPENGSEKSLEAIRAELKVARAAFAQAKVDGAENIAELQQAYKQAREKSLEVYNDDPRYYARRSAAEMEALTNEMMTAAGDDAKKQKMVRRFRDSALAQPTVRKGLNVGRQTNELKGVHDAIEDVMTAGTPNVEQFAHDLHKEGENLTKAQRVQRAVQELTRMTDEKFEALVATDVEKQYAGPLGRRLLERWRTLRASRKETLADREAHEQWEKDTREERTEAERGKRIGKMQDVSYMMGGLSEAQKDDHVRIEAAVDEDFTLDNYAERRNAFIAARKDFFAKAVKAERKQLQRVVDSIAEGMLANMKKKRAQSQLDALDAQEAAIGSQAGIDFTVANFDRHLELMLAQDEAQRDAAFKSMKEEVVALRKEHPKSAHEVEQKFLDAEVLMAHEDLSDEIEA